MSKENNENTVKERHIQQGWECPKCGTVNAPWKDHCGCANYTPCPTYPTYSTYPIYPYYPTYPIYPYYTICDSSTAEGKK